MFPIAQTLEGMTWVPGPYPGVELAILERDAATGGVTVLRKFHSGITVPAHIHPMADEWVCVISGEWVEDGQTFGPGSILQSPRGVRHGPHHAKTEVLSLTRFNGPLTVSPRVSPVSHKSPRIAALLADLDSDAPNTEGLPRHYLGFFRCFNHGLYFEAHDVLEELWLADGKTGANYAFYKGLIQWAGAFVHLQKGRLRPAVALFNLATTNLKQYPTIHLRLDLLNALEDMRSWRQDIEASEFQTNPLTQRPAPQITLLPPQSPLKPSDAVISTVPHH